MPSSEPEPWDFSRWKDVTSLEEPNGWWMKPWQLPHNWCLPNAGGALGTTEGVTNSRRPGASGKAGTWSFNRSSHAWQGAGRGKASKFYLGPWFYQITHLPELLTRSQMDKHKLACPAFPLLPRDANEQQWPTGRWEEEQQTAYWASWIASLLLVMWPWLHCSHLCGMSLITTWLLCQLGLGERGPTCGIPSAHGLTESQPLGAAPSGRLDDMLDRDFEDKVWLLLREWALLKTCCPLIAVGWNMPRYLNSNLTSPS